MGDFYSKFLQLCSQHHVSPSGVAKAIGLSNAAANGWKNGKKPSDTTLLKIANYFEVDVSTLKQDPPTLQTEDGGIDPKRQELLDLVHGLTDDDMGLMLNMIRTLKTQREKKEE